MCSWKKKRDHGSFELKLLLRKKLIRGITQAAALDLFAGEGRLLLELCAGFERVHAVEKDPAKWSVLTRRLQEEGRANVSVWRMDNASFIREVLPGIGGINFIDLDSYGNPLPAVKRLFSVWRPERTTAVAVTDGGRLSFIRGGRVRMKNYLPGEDKPRIPGCKAACPAGTRPLSAGEYELLVKGFWKGLAADMGFSIEDFILAWKKGKGVMYYGMLIRPDKDHMGAHRKAKPQPLEPQQDGQRLHEKAYEGD